MVNITSGRFWATTASGVSGLDEVSLGRSFNVYFLV